MSTSTTTYAIESVAVEPHSGVPWWLVLIEGIAAILMGVLLVTRPGLGTVVLVQLLGLYWLISGIFSIIAIFIDSSMWGWKLFAGVLGILAGMLIIQHPFWSALLVPATLVIVLGIWGLLIGVIEIIQAFQGAGWGRGVLGVLSIIFGLFLLGNSFLAALSLPLVVGIFAIVGGALAIFGSFRIRSEAARYAEAAAARSASVKASAPAVASMPAGAAPVSAAAAAAAVAAPSRMDETPVVETPRAAAEEVSMAATETGQGVGMLEEAAVFETANLVEGTAPVEGVGTPVAGEAMAVEETVERAGEVETAQPAESAKFSYDLAYVEGIGPVYAQKLQAIGIANPSDLLERGSTPKGRIEIAEQTEISGKLILEWVNHVDLYRIKGVGSEYADLLEEAGVDTVVELATRNPANLYQKIVEVNEEKKLVRKTPVQSQVEDWVAQSKQLPRKVMY